MATKRYAVQRYENENAASTSDLVAVEQPLEIRVKHRDVEQVIAVTMRTPGHDRELAVGFLRNEGLLSKNADVNVQSANVILVSVDDESEFDFDDRRRSFLATSSCGICGIASLSDVEREFEAIGKTISMSPADLRICVNQLRDAQSTFEKTGGLHACAAFASNAELVCCFEDVGRHNAMDKCRGFDTDGLTKIVVWSGRASFELVQKAIVSGVEFAIAIGAPSTAAIDLANEAGLTLVGFFRESRFNIYTHPERVVVRA